MSAKLFGLVGGIAFLTLIILAPTSGPLLKKLGLVTPSETRKKVVAVLSKATKQYVLHEYIALLTEERFHDVDFTVVKDHIPILADINYKQVMAAVRHHKESSPEKTYKKPNLKNVIGSSTKPELSSDDNYLTKRMSTEETQLLGSYANTESESPPACSSVSTSSSDFDIILNDQNSSQSGITEPSVYDKYGVKDGLVLPLKSKEAMKVALKHAAATHSAKQAKMKKPTRQLRQSESSQSDMAKSVEALLSKYAMSCMNAHDMSTNAIDDSYRQNYVRSEGLRTSAGDESVCSASRIRSKSEDTTGLNKKEESTLESTCSITRSRSSQQLSTSSTSRYSSIDTSDLENHKPSSKGGISSSDEVSSACDSELV